MTIQKRSNRNIASDLGTCHKYVVQFTDPNPTSYSYAKRVNVDIFKYANTKYNPIKWMFVSDCVWNAMYNL